MKKVIFGALALGMIMFSCNKEEIIPRVSNTTKQGDPTVNSNKHRVFLVIGDDHGGILDCACDGSGGNCLADVEVTASIVNDIDNVIKVVNMSNKQDVIDVFTHYQTTLESVIQPKYVIGVINRVYTVKVFSSSTSKTDFFNFYDSNNVSVSVQPLKK